MRLLVTLALRNLFRHKRRTLLTASALVLGIALMVLGRAWTAAMEKAVVEPAKRDPGPRPGVREGRGGRRGRRRSPSSCPRTTTACIPEPRRLIDAHLRAEPRLQAGLRAAHGRGAALVGRRLDGGDPDRHRPRRPRRRSTRPSSCARAASSARGEGRPREPRRGAQARASAWATRWWPSATPRTDGSPRAAPVTGIWMVRRASRRTSGGPATRASPPCRSCSTPPTRRGCWCCARRTTTPRRPRRRVGERVLRARGHPRRGVHLGGDGRAVHRRVDR